MKVEKLLNYEVTCLDCGSKLSFTNQDIFEKPHESKTNTVNWGYILCPTCNKEIHVRYEKEYCDKVNFNYGLNKSDKGNIKMTSLDKLNTNIEQLIKLLSNVKISIEDEPYNSESESDVNAKAAEISTWLNNCNKKLLKVKLTKAVKDSNTSNSIFITEQLAKLKNREMSFYTDYFTYEGFIPNLTLTDLGRTLCTVPKAFGYEIDRPTNDTFKVCNDIISYKKLYDINNTYTRFLLVNFPDDSLYKMLQENFPLLDCLLISVKNNYFDCNNDKLINKIIVDSDKGMKQVYDSIKTSKDLIINYY